MPKPRDLLFLAGVGLLAWASWRWITVPQLAREAAEASASARAAEEARPREIALPDGFQTLVRAVAREVVLDGEVVYWLECGGGGVDCSLRGVARSGDGEPTTLWSKKKTAPHDLVVGKDSLYWLEPEGLFQCPKSTGQPALVARPGGQPRALALDGERPVWIDGSEIKRLEEGTPRSVATLPGPASALHSDGRQIFVAATDPETRLSRIYVIPEVGFVKPLGAVSTIAGVSPPSIIVGDDEALYFVSGKCAFRQAKAGGEPSQLVCGELPPAIALRGDELVSTNGPAIEARAKIGGGSPRRLLEFKPTTFRFAGESFSEIFRPHLLVADTRGVVLTGNGLIGRTR